MKAIQADQISSGFDQVRVIEQEKPAPGPGEILVRMQYAPINPSDLNYIHGTYASALQGVIWNINPDYIWWINLIGDAFIVLPLMIMIPDIKGNSAQSVRET